MRQLILMQGLPGSGKSTVANAIRTGHLGDGPVEFEDSIIIRSTDDFWYQDNPAVYAYDRARAAEAHRWNQQRVVKDMQLGLGTIIIDNTNIAKWEAEPYMVLARIFNYEVSVVRVSVPVRTAIQRQLERPEDRRVPEHIIRSMAMEMEDLL